MQLFQFVEQYFKINDITTLIESSDIALETNIKENKDQAIQKHAKKKSYIGGLNG